MSDPNNIKLSLLYTQRDKMLFEDPNAICKERIEKLLKYKKVDDSMVKIIRLYWNNCHTWDILENFYESLNYEDLVLLGY
jgi:hypothetical protein